MNEVVGNLAPHPGHVSNLGCVNSIQLEPDQIVDGTRDSAVGTAASRLGAQVRCVSNSFRTQVPDGRRSRNRPLAAEQA